MLKPSILTDSLDFFQDSLSLLFPSNLFPFPGKSLSRSFFLLLTVSFSHSILYPYIFAFFRLDDTAIFRYSGGFSLRGGGDDDDDGAVFVVFALVIIIIT